MATCNMLYRGFRILVHIKHLLNPCFLETGQLHNIFQWVGHQQQASTVQPLFMFVIFLCLIELPCDCAVLIDTCFVNYVSIIYTMQCNLPPSVRKLFDYQDKSEVSILFSYEGTFELVLPMQLTFMLLTNVLTRSFVCVKTYN